jgi:hypothetical protein
VLLEKAIEEHKNAARLLREYQSPEAERGRLDDIFVRPYIVRAHWRIRVRYKRKSVQRQRLDTR